ncbi:hypothetical protein M422DRAFT_74981 [Sphaerobolus stellatus SS14]|uniref:C3H1-type domain-containing protein n=1 Tax=Sphaerobolus stellatus (strain SS14) TaxID=990650 RepID=A0A0C9URJ8_SPHS4|nr:hypothetical protein M422DRAFT_74981 [Sphaerobolus stellatus SS14]
MLYDESTASSLRPWLIRTLQPICDADPEALADYVIALLKHDAPEPQLRKMFIGQLEEFLEKEAEAFVDSLLAALRTKSYLPYEPVKAETQDGAIPIPLDAFVSTGASSDRRRKRSLEADDNEHPPPKGPRLSSEGFSRYGPANGRGRGRGGHMNPQPHMQMEGQIFPQQVGYGGRPRRGVCRDYHNNGFCARGALCQYSHGEDAVIPQMPYADGAAMMNMGSAAPFIQMYPGFMGLPGTTYDPHESLMDMGPRGRGSRNEGRDPSVIQDLTPADPAEEAGRERTLQPNGFTHNFGTPRRAQQPPQMAMQQPPQMTMQQSPQMAMQQQHAMQAGFNMPMEGVQMQQSAIQQQPGFRRHPKGAFNEPFRNTPRDDKTLVVEKIPEDKLSLEAVNDWFKRFGTVTNVAIDATGSKALVSFSNHTEAYAAWKSEEAVFNNRFVKLFWHRPLEGQGTRGQKALAASAPLVKNMTTGEETKQSNSPPANASSLPQQHPSQRPDPATVAALAARQRLLEKLISEQKVLMSRLSTASTPEEKKEIMDKLKSIQNDMTASPAPVTIPAVPKPANDQPTPLSDKEKLDTDIEMQVQTEIKTEAPGGDSTAALKEKLAQLKAEASKLGLPEAEGDSSQPPYSSSFRPYRGRGFRARGAPRGGFVGRGGPPRSSMKLDNRPRKLLIEDVPATEEAIHAVRTYYQDIGNLESFWKEGDGRVVAQFWTRPAAETALAKGLEIPNVGKVKIGWHTGPAPSSTPITSTSPAPVPASVAVPVPAVDQKKIETDMPVDIPVVARHGEQDDGGWGQAFDDDEGEGRRRRSRSRSF